MSTYELADDLVREFVDGRSPSAREALVGALQRQLPLPVPTKIGAVVRTDKGVYVRVRTEPWTPWSCAVGEESGGEHADPGRITEVLAEGVDL